MVKMLGVHVIRVRPGVLQVAISAQYETMRKIFTKVEKNDWRADREKK